MLRPHGAGLMRSVIQQDKEIILILRYMTHSQCEHCSLNLACELYYAAWVKCLHLIWHTEGERPRAHNPSAVGFYTVAMP